MSDFNYERRPIRFLELRKHNDWSIKVYGIRLGGEKPDNRLMEQAYETALGRLPKPAHTDTRYATGLLCVHQGRRFAQCILGWWEHENEFHHRYFVTEEEDTIEFQESIEGDHILCTWELRLLGFERDAWIKHVAANTDGPDLQAYLLE